MRIFPIDDTPFEWNRTDPGDNIHLYNIVVFRTLSLNKFLLMSKVKALSYHLTEHRYLYAKIPDCFIEIPILGHGLPRRPYLTLISDADGDLHWIMHDEGIKIDMELILFKQGYLSTTQYQRIIRDGYSNYRRNIDDYNESQIELNNLYNDAFEGDYDAYWNID